LQNKSISTANEMKPTTVGTMDSTSIRATGGLVAGTVGVVPLPLLLLVVCDAVVMVAEDCEL